jgi:hypothetical protein
MSFERSKRRTFTVAAVLAVALVAPSTVWAASPDERAAARQHLNQAEELKKKGKLAEACKHLEQVEHLDPKLPTLMDLAECTEQVGDLVRAQAQWASARDRAKHDEKPQSRARAETRLAAIQKRLAHLTLQLAANTPAAAQVLSDDAPVEAASLASTLPMNPGDHVIVVKLAGHDDAKYPVKLADGDNQTLAIAAGPTAGTQAAPPPPAPPPSSPLPAPSSAPLAAVTPTKEEAPPATGWWSGSRTAGVIFGAAGLAAVGGGAALCLVGKPEAPEPRVALGGIALASGGVLLVTGLVLLASAPSDEPAQHAHVTVTPTLMLARDATVLGAFGEF